MPLKLIFDPYWLKLVAVWEAGKKSSINHKTRGLTSQRGQRSEVEKSKRLDGPETLGAAASERSGLAAAIALFHVKPTRDTSFIKAKSYAPAPVPSMIMTTVVSYRFWPPITLEERYLRF